MRRRLSSLLGRLSSLAPALARLGGHSHAALFTRTGGRRMRRWFGAPVLVLETVGRRSGQPRRTPLIYLADGERAIVVGANGGAPDPPAWWLNLREVGTATATFGGRRREVTAREVTGAERDQLWTRFAQMYPALDDYAKRTDREFPFVVLEPVSRPS